MGEPDRDQRCCAAGQLKQPAMKQHGLQLKLLKPGPLDLHAGRQQHQRQQQQENSHPSPANSMKRSWWSVSSSIRASTRRSITSRRDSSRVTA